jgi:peroxiredoxin
LFAVPGAFTPTCSAKHVPGYVEKAAEFKAAGVDEIWCVSVNDAFVMGAWARDQKTGGKVRMLADGDAAFAKATGLTLDLDGKGMGLRSNRYSMLVQGRQGGDLNIEAPGKFEVSDAATLAGARPRLDQRLVQDGGRRSGGIGSLASTRAHRCPRARWPRCRR